GGGRFGGGGGVLARGSELLLELSELLLELGELVLELRQLGAQVIDFGLKALAVGAGGRATHGPCSTPWPAYGTSPALEPAQRSSPSVTAGQGVNRYVGSGWRTGSSPPRASVGSVGRR